jgi:hypothetical protein
MKKRVFLLHPSSFLLLEGCFPMRTLPLALLLVIPSLAHAAEPAKVSPEDKAIRRGLEFLHDTQNKDGSWRGNSGPHPAVTSLAVMAFLSAGHVPGEGRYGPTVERGIRWVLRQQHANGLIASESAHEMYHHGIATLMLAEVAGMTDGDLGRDVRRALEKAVAIILKAQRTRGSERGGWRYRAAHVNGSDLSVTGWQVMALRGAKNLGCDVPASTIAAAMDYVKRSQDRYRGGFCYTPRGGLTVACTGTGILCLELGGKEEHLSDKVKAAGTYLVRRSSLPRRGQRFFYYSIYYGAQATFQLGGNYWKVYRPALHAAVLPYQNSNGSWSGGGTDAAYGPNYCTAMSLLALTVEYRLLPIYQRSEEEPGKG